MARKDIAFKEDLEKMIGLSNGLQVTYGKITHTISGSVDSGHEVTIPHMVNLLFVWTEVTAFGTNTSYAPFPTVAVLSATPTSGISTANKLVFLSGSAPSMSRAEASLSTTATSAKITAKKTEGSSGTSTFYYAALKLY